MAHCAARWLIGSIYGIFLLSFFRLAERRSSKSRFWNSLGRSTCRPDSPSAIFLKPSAKTYTEAQSFHLNNPLLLIDIWKDAQVRMYELGNRRENHVQSHLSVFPTRICSLVQCQTPCCRLNIEANLMSFRSKPRSSKFNACTKSEKTRDFSFGK